MTKKVNLIFAKRGRDDYLRLALHNLNLSEDIENFDVAVYVGEDIKENINKIDYGLYKNLKINHFYVPNLPQAGKLFCKDHILSEILNKMRPDYDWFSIMDTDIIYRKDWLKHIAEHMDKSHNQFILCHGHRVGSKKNYTHILQKNYDYTELRDKFTVSVLVGTSQISLSKELHNSICDLMSIKNLYDFHSLGYHFLGWGREDSLVLKMLNFSKRDCIVINKVWAHVWHEHQELKEETTRYNTQILSLLEEEVRKRLRESKSFRLRLSKITGLTNK